MMLGILVLATLLPQTLLIEPVMTIASAIPTTIASGIGGLVSGALGDSEDAAETQKAIQEGGTFKPRTAEGKEGLKTLGDLVKTGGDILNYPLSGLVGLVDLISSGGDINAAADAVKSTQEQGIKKELGGRAFEATGSPAVATFVELIPDMVMTAAGLRAVKPTTKAVETGTKEIVELGKDVARFKTPTKRRIAEELQEGGINSDIARLKLSDEGIASPTARQRLLGADKPSVARDSSLIGAAKQGFDEGFLETVKKAGSIADKNALIKMTNIAKKGRTNPVFRSDQRPSFVAGDVLLDKVNIIKGINRAAGQRIGNAERYLKGRFVPVSDIGDSFLSSLDKLKITIKPDGKLDFKDALISGAGRKKAIIDIFDRMTRNKNPDALDLHQLKQFIDETVSYGKTVRGLGGKAENALKELRADIKNTLDNNFPNYKKANSAYSDTIDVLDRIQKLAGTKTDLTSNSASGQLAILARRITSNAQSRGRVKDAFLDLDKVIDKHATRLRLGDSDGKIDFNLLMEYADQLDKVTGSAAKTSFAGGIETAGRAVRGPKEFLIDKELKCQKKQLG